MRGRSLAENIVGCPYCKCFFVSAADLKRHMAARHWRKSRNGGEWEWMFASEAGDLLLKLRSLGEFADGEYLYRLSGDGRIIFRKRMDI